jgi:prolyl 4-hydroxylase
VVDTIYRRAADVLQIDESLLRHASPHHDNIASHHAISEDMQLVHYQKGQEYTPHHDFVYPSISNRHQPSRFATLLIYLHAPSDGGEDHLSSVAAKHISRWTQLFYRKLARQSCFTYMLPDGNVDDLSQHGSRPVENGEKWIANLWVWDPIID